MTHRTIRLLGATLAISALTGCVSETGDDSGSDSAEPLRGTFWVQGQPVDLEYDVVDGRMMFGGDMVLEAEDQVLDPQPADGQVSQPLFAKKSDGYLWPKGRIPFAIAASVSETHRNRLKAAMLEWESNTPVRFVKRTTESAYVTFKEPSAQSVCAATVGYRAGTRRYVYLRNSSKYGACNRGVITHEIGHVLGFLHEHQRPDRNNYVNIRWNCVPSGLSSNFQIIDSGARKVGGYDIKSTMHYRSTSLTSGCYSIVAKDGSALLHDWADLSAGDVKATTTLYGSPYRVY